MASQSQGIQQLLAAEKRAAEKVNEARKRKARRLKQAKEEAQADIDAFKREREQKFKEIENQILGSRTDIEEKIRQQTAQRIQELGGSYNKNKDKLISRTLEIVMNIHPEVHMNYKPE